MKQTLKLWLLTSCRACSRPVKRASSLCTRFIAALAAILICGASVLVFTGCQNGARKSSSPEATAKIIAASEAKDHERVLSLADRHLVGRSAHLPWHPAELFFSNYVRKLMKQY